MSLTHPRALGKVFLLWASVCLALKWDSISYKADFEFDLPYERGN